MGIRRKAGMLLSLCFFFFLAVMMALWEEGTEENNGNHLSKTVSMDAAKAGEKGIWAELWKTHIKAQFPLVDAAAGTPYEQMTGVNWITSVFSHTFYINHYASNNTQAAAAYENQQALEASLVLENHGLVLPESLLKNKNLPEEEGRIPGEIYQEEYEETEAGAQFTQEELDALKINQSLINKLVKNKSLDDLIQNFYIVNPTTAIDHNVFNVEKLLQKDCTMKKNKTEPQILIYHTHGASEKFSDSRKGEAEDSVIGVGEYLAQLLRSRGYQVIHDETPYDLINGAIDRNKAYNEALTGLEKTLAENPDIEVLIDLHRDASKNGEKRVTTIGGKSTAQIMFFNGLSRNLNGEIAYLENPNLQGNLAFSLQMKLKAMKLYPDLTTRIFLKGYRYNLHLREKSLLIELGNEANTVEESKNAMVPLAEILDRVLSGEAESVPAAKGS